MGFSVGLGLYLIGLIRRSDDLKRASLVIFLGIGLLTIPTFMTGKAAQAAITGQEGVSDTLMATHEDAALLAFLFMTLTGALSWLGLWQYRRVSRIAGWNAAAILLVSLVTFGLMARAADIGGEIRHPEIQAAGDATAASTELVQGAAIQGFVNTTNWAWPTMETLHFIGLVMLMGVVLIVNLRMLGIAKNVSFASIHRLLPWGVLGFLINVVTGIVFFITVPDQYTQNIALEYKIAVTMIAGTIAMMRVMRRRSHGWRRMFKKPSITIWPASVPVSVEFWPEARSASAKSVLAPVTPSSGESSL